MNGPAVSQADDPQEQWNKVHAQLLKSVADAQARLLAAQNETCDRLEAMSKDSSALGAIFNQLRDEQESQRRELQAGIMSLGSKLDAIRAILAELLAKPRRRILDPSIARAKRRKR